MADYMLCLDGMEGDPGLLSFPCDQLKTMGTVCTVPAGEVPDSLGCILRLLGARAAEIPAGRAAWEALACGIPVAPRDAVFRCTLCGVDSVGRLQPLEPERAERILYRLGELARPNLPKGWALHPMTGYRALLCIQDGADQLEGVCTAPPHQHYGAAVETCIPSGGGLGTPLQRFTRVCATYLAGYALIPWGQSVMRPMFSFAQRTGVQASMVCHAEIVRGLALALGMRCPRVPGATADVDTDLRAKYRVAIGEARDRPLVFVHINGCDEAGHRRDAIGKSVFLQRVVRELLLPLLTGLQPGERLLLCSDHQTQSETGRHGAQPVHFWIYEGGYQSQPAEYPLQDAAAPLRLLLDRGGN